MGLSGLHLCLLLAAANMMSRLKTFSLCPQVAVALSSTLFSQMHCTCHGLTLSFPIKPAKPTGLLHAQPGSLAGSHASM